MLRKTTTSLKIQKGLIERQGPMSKWTYDELPLGFISTVIETGVVSKEQKKNLKESTVQSVPVTGAAVSTLFDPTSLRCCYSDQTVKDGGLAI